MTPDELADIIEIAGLSDSCSVFDIDQHEAETEAILLLRRVAKQQAERVVLLWMWRLGLAAFVIYAWFFSG
jgi:hypothetical protein